MIPSIPGDQYQLRTMLARFVENAREALPEGCGTIEFSTHTDSRDWVILTIRDSGCGMSQEVQRRASEPFFSTKEDHAGVGLTIAQVIWRRHRGALSIESSPGAGNDGPAVDPAAARPAMPLSVSRDQRHDRHHRLWNGQPEERSEGDRGGRSGGRDHLGPGPVRQASKVVLPGVGAFADAMAELRRTGLGEAFCEAVRAGKPCLGVCLGLQLLFDTSHEDGEHRAWVCSRAESNGLPADRV